ncbi:helix-turn-helix transcriptional regulator [Victivallis lenta]|uniref:helix-turn-helix transcriptional regulator n=1 Tax=Victivallis lenta TaxID=2606640 RepID=UPI0015A78C37|nr:AraC family transcriptional regulator [Victivallis lenta]
MKILEDISAFRWEPLPPPCYFEGMEFFHRRSRRSFRMRALPAGIADDLLRIDCICEVDLLPQAHYMRRCAPFLSIEYVKQGSLLVRQRGKAYELEKGEIFLMQPQIENEFLSGEGGCRKISVMIVGKLLEPFLAESGLGMRDVAVGLDSRHIEWLFQEIEELADEAPDDASCRNSRLTFEFLQSLRIPSDIHELPELLAELREELRLHPEYDWSQRRMAGWCGCSGTHLVRLFRRYFDTTPRQYLLELRMRHAKRLLADEKLSIKEISARAGYNNALNFSTGFRKRFGISPREYRRQLSIFS